MYPITLTYNFEFSCKTCPNRYPGCHGECETYKKERALYDEQKVEWDKKRSAKIYSSNAIASTLNAEAKQRKSTRGYKNFRR